MTNIITANYQCNGNSVNADELGMREMQRRAYLKFDSQYLLLKSPPASGKSRALMYIAIEKLSNKLVKKVIVAVPERSIAKSFNSINLKQSGFHSDWNVKPENDLCMSRGDKSKTVAFKRFMDSDDRILLCTHSTLRFGFDSLSSSTFNDCLIAIDEFHHVSASVENKLGEILREVMRETNASILAMTGSYFRGDSLPILSPNNESKFTKVTYNYYEQLNGYNNLKTLGIGFHFYNGCYLDALNDVLDTTKKTIVYIPNVNSSESTKEKLHEVDSIIEKIGVYKRTDDQGIIHVKTQDGRTLKIADLVTDDMEREKVIGYLRDVKKEEDIDIIITLNMAKEGFDWPFCESTLTAGYRGSLTEIIQIIGRCTRDSSNKTHAQFTNLIAELDATSDVAVESVNNMLKAIAASLLMEEVLAPKFDFRCKNKGNGDGMQINIKDYIPPKSERVIDIIDNDISDLKAKILQTPEIQAAFLGAVDPEVLNKALIPKVIQEVYPDLKENELEELRDYVVTSFAVTNSNTVTEGNNKFIYFVDKLVNVTDISMDLIYSVNPFLNSFKVMSKHFSGKVFQAIQQCIQAMKIRMTDDEAKLLWPKINNFVKTSGREPSLDAIDPLERRMAEALVYVRQITTEKTT